MDTVSPEHMVCQALECACSQDINLLKQAEAKLSEWETERGFYTMLASILTNQSTNVNIRWMAAVYFKNGINKYWRRNAKNEIEASEKIQIRIHLMNTFHEPVPQVAEQIAALIAKIARFDCPRDWPDLVPNLLERVDTTDELQQHRALLILQNVIKALSSKRLVSEIKLFEELTHSLYGFIMNLCDRFTNLFFQCIQENNTSEISRSYLEKAILALRIMRKLTIYGIYKPVLSKNCMIFMESLFQRIKESVECRYQLRQKNVNMLVDPLEKFIIKQMKILNEFAEHHPYSFIKLIPTALEFSFNYVFDSDTYLIYDGDTINFTNFAIRCINLMERILSSSFCSARNKDADLFSNDEDASFIATAKTTFCTTERVSYICQKLLTHYFLLTKADLDIWSNDPEVYSSDEGGESWKYALRPCTGKLFSTMFSQFRKDTTAEVCKYISKAQENTLTENSTLNNILSKDAIYFAAGLVAFDLYDEVDFNSWFINQLSSELKIRSSAQFCIIHKRIIWLVGRWTAINFDRNLRTQVYELCLHFLQPEENMAVRLEASKTLISTITDFDFEAEPFLQYLHSSFHALFNLLKEAKECDSKMNVLSIMSFIVGEMTDYIKPQTDKLISYLPLLWKESEDHEMLRCAIISTMIKVVKALGNIPPNLSPFLYPIIDLSTDVKQASHVYLRHEGLELWLAVVENCETISPELLELCKNIVPMIEMSSENMFTIFCIVQAYILLNPEAYLCRYGKEIISMCAYLLSDMRPAGIADVMKLFETCLRAEPNFSLELLKPHLPSIFKDICENKNCPVVMSTYFAIASRILLLNQYAFIQALQETNIPNAFETFLDVFLVTMPIVTLSEKRKLLSLALVYIITLNNNAVIERLPGIFQCIWESLNDIMREGDDGVLVDSLVCTDDNGFGSITLWTMEDFECKTFHYDRCSQLCQKDPVHTVVLKDYLQSQITTMKTNFGVERFKTLMMSIDTIVLKQLQEYIDIGIQLSN